MEGEVKQRIQKILRGFVMFVMLLPCCWSRTCNISDIKSKWIQNTRHAICHNALNRDDFSFKFLFTFYVIFSHSSYTFILSLAFITEWNKAFSACTLFKICVHVQRMMMLKV